SPSPGADARTPRGRPPGCRPRPAVPTARAHRRRGTDPRTGTERRRRSDGRDGRRAGAGTPRSVLAAPTDALHLCVEIADGRSRQGRVARDLWVTRTSSSRSTADWG